MSLISKSARVLANHSHAEEIPPEDRPNQTTLLEGFIEMRQIVAELLEPCAVRRVTPCLFNCLQLFLNHDSSAVNLLLPLSENVCEPRNEPKFRAYCSQMDGHPPREFVAQLWLTFLLLVSGFPLASLAQPRCTLQVSVRDNKRNPIAEAKISARLESPITEREFHIRSRARHGILWALHAATPVVIPISCWWMRRFQEIFAPGTTTTSRFP